MDYIGICLSQRAGGDANSYTTLKAVSEELRGLAAEFNAVVVSSAQTNRNGMGSNDLEMTDISDSTGQLMTADFIVAWIRTEELDASKNAMMKILKSRYGSTVDNKRSLVAVDYGKMTVSSVNGKMINDEGYIAPTKQEKTGIDWSGTGMKSGQKKDYGSIKF